ncbi:MAG: hypothetical protein EXS08_06825 [Planctomycetes bacterium]|nr:hypothetical protein [Planctomycetota bacterium]
MSPLTSERLALLRATLAAKGVAQPHAGAIPRRADAARAPLSFAQERLFFLELYQPGTALYNDAVLVRIEGALDVERLRAALALVQQRHQILRTSFALTGQGAEQRIQHSVAPPLEVLDVVDEAEARAHAAAEARRPFELERAPLWRVLLARRGPELAWLVLAMHHIVSDGASLGLFFDELTRAYDGGPAALAPLVLQFGDYAAWERASFQEARAEGELAYWRATLGGEREACRWNEVRGSTSQQGGFVALELEAHTRTGLARFAREAHATPNQVLLAAWLALLSAAGRQTDLCTGIASSLRQQRALEPLIGFFVQSLALRCDLGGDPSFADLVQRVRASALAAQEHGGVPFDRVVRALGTSPGAAPLLQTFFAHMRDAIRASAFAGTRATWEFVDPGVARFELALVLHESAERLHGFLEYDEGVFSAESAATLAADYQRLLATAVTAPATRLAQLVERCTTRTPRRNLLSFPTRLRRAAGGGA